MDPVRTGIKKQQLARPDPLFGRSTCCGIRQGGHRRPDALSKLEADARIDAERVHVSQRREAQRGGPARQRRDQVVRAVLQHLHGGVDLIADLCAPGAASI